MFDKDITTTVIMPLDDRTYCTVLDLRSLVWGFGESCTIFHGITSQPANVFSYVPNSHFHRSPTGWLNFEMRSSFQPRYGGG